MEVMKQSGCVYLEVIKLAFCQMHLSVLTDLTDAFSLLFLSCTKKKRAGTLTNISDYFCPKFRSSKISMSSCLQTKFRFSEPFLLVNGSAPDWS
jgi:hypothetical protein